MGSPLTTHVLDTARGVPAAGMDVTLARWSAAGWTTVAERTTNADGRVTDLLPPDGLHKGRWRLSFEVAGYYARLDTACFFPEAELVFEVVDLSRHHHVPLLVSPFSFSTYRGS
jgi:5-hydroxyisourate hydrolase